MAENNPQNTPSDKDEFISTKKVNQGKSCLSNCFLIFPTGFCCAILPILVILVFFIGIFVRIQSLDPKNSSDYANSGTGNQINEDCITQVAKKFKAGCADKAKDYVPAINEYAQKYNVDPALVAATIHQESGWCQNAISPVGAIGLMQLMPLTAVGLGVNPLDANQNIKGGTKYTSQNLKMFNNNLDSAIAAYNAGPGAVQKYGGVPPYSETQNYVKLVKSLYTQYKKCLSGTSTPSSCPEIAQKAVDLAKSKVGSPYTQAANQNLGPNSFDCAGLYGWAWWEASGRKWDNMHHSYVPSFTKDLNYFPIKSESDLQPGDAVFRRAYINNVEQSGSNTVSPNHDYGHIGMYAGNGEVVHAASTARGVVKDKFNISDWALEAGRPKKCSTGSTATSSLNIIQKPLPDMAKYKKQIQEYSKNHYHEDSSQLTPKIIVLHYTATSSFPDNLSNGASIADETGYIYTNGAPPLTAHYVIDGDKIYQILPNNIKSRGAYGVNQEAINIEVVALNSSDLATRAQSLEKTAQLTQMLMKQNNISLNNVYGHYDVSNGTVPGYLNYKPNSNQKTTASQDYTGSGQGKVDPGVQNMSTIKTKIQQLNK